MLWGDGLKKLCESDLESEEAKFLFSNEFMRFSQADARL